MKRSINQVIDYKSNDERTWFVQDQPSNKMHQNGPKALTDTDLLAVLLSGTKNATDVARSIFNEKECNLSAVARLTLPELMSFGMSKNKAAIIKAAFELGARTKNHIDMPVQIKSSDMVKNIMQPLIGDLDHEEFWVITMNRVNKVIRKHKISQGGLSGTVIDSRIILKKALDDLASTLILVHNHPSGNPDPSEADMKITSRLKQSAELMELKVLDHVILTTDRCYSMADEGKL